MLAWKKLDGVSNISLSRSLFYRVQLDRNLREYRFLLQICELFYNSLLINPSDGSVRFTDFRSDRKLMWRVFEDFVREFYRREQSTYKVLDERKISWDGLGGATVEDIRHIPVMLADVLLESKDRRIVLDTKFYEAPLNYRYGTEKLRSANLYQMLTYLKNRQATRPPGPQHEGILLYAAVDRGLRMNVELNGFTVRIRSVDLSQNLSKIRREMLEIIGA